MGQVETNIFPLINLSELKTNYRLYKIKGLTPEQDEYYQNCQYIIRKLSFELLTPVTIIEQDRSPLLVVPTDAGDPPSPFTLVRTAVTFEPLPETFTLDYTCRTSENDKIALRFLQFWIQTPLRNRQELWQPKSGSPFFTKKPKIVNQQYALYTGFSVRSIISSEGNLGLSVDATSKLISPHPLPVHLTHNDFTKWKGSHCIYHYGHLWYELRIETLSDQNVTEYLVPKDGSWISLLDYIIAESRKPIPEEITRVPHDASVVLYRDNRNQERAAPSILCYPILDTSDDFAGRQQGQTILAPDQRRQLIIDFVNRYLQNMRFGNAALCIGNVPISAPRKMFIVPDLLFGNETVLSVRGTAGAQQVSLDALGSARLSLLTDQKVGFYNHDPLDRQYLILPKNVYESFGKRFIEDLKGSVNALFYQEGGYNPITISYNDTGPKTVSYQGKVILETVKANCQKPGYAVIMIHRTSKQREREEDQLAAMVIRELRGMDIAASVIHPDVGQECYRLITGKDGEPSYVPIGNKQGKFHGYLRNLALNKVLLTNQRWPFILADRLNADLTIGIDVKHHTAGLVVVGSNGGEIRSLLKVSKLKEQLSGNLLESLLTEILRRELSVRMGPLKTIVIHRDGIAYPSEIDQAKRAISNLKQADQLDKNAALTILEIPKTSAARLRLFETFEESNADERTKNPQVGYYYLINEKEGYICNTGRAFYRPGTVRPLHVKRVYGDLPIEKCLSDLYALSTLAWTRPEDCTRYPITLKLNDRFLLEDATEYDEDGLVMEDNSDSEGEE